ncbi:MAG: EAL domain-containing protein [Methylotenera sp.]|uniref:bifunctional diguanylate cyclase/phosphodiesterase n=1 Tax=Methylotenera sp. TaxID=2051956 RepID=UPI00248780CA|nr:EAL domain-containing protein [Methylotenera sp.]MDI1310063.1 EAL domain-containing protein [Methylotenera sp.]
MNKSAKLTNITASILKNYRRVDVPLNLTVLLVYLVIAKLGLAFSLMESGATIFWPAGGFALAILLLAGPKYIPGVFGGALAAGLMIGATPTFSVLSALGNTLETVCAYWLLTYVRPINRSLDRPQDYLSILFYGAAISTLISAAIGPLSLVVLQLIEPSLLHNIALRWWMGDAVGIALVTPLILIWHQSHQQPENKISLELIALFLLTILMGQIVLLHGVVTPSRIDPDIAWLIPFIIWSGLRAGLRYTSLLILIIFLQALWGASHGVGHYANDMQESGLVNFWMFSMLIAVGGMLLAIMTTENKQSELTLKSSEERLVLATISNGVGIWDWNLQTQEMTWDDSMFALYHIRREDFSGALDAWEKSLHPDDHEQANREIQAALSGEKPFDTVFRVIWHNGETHFIKAVAKVFRDDSGMPVRMLGSNVDITLFKLTEQTLLESKTQLNFMHQQLQALIKAIPDLVWLKDINGVYLTCNRRFEKFFGAKEKDIVGKTDYDFVDKELADFFRAHDQIAVQTGAACINEEQVTFADDGHTEFLETTKTPVLDADGSIIGVLGIGHDITERKQAEETLQASQQQFRDLVDSTSGIVWEADAKTFSFTFISQEAERLLGFAVADWSRPGFWVEHLHPDDRSWAPEYCASCTGRAEAHNFEYRFIAKDGRTVWLHDMVKVVVEDGSPRWLRGVMMDITASKQAEEKLSLAASVFTNARECILITDAFGSIIEVNDTFSLVTGYSREEAIGQNPRMLQSGRQSPEFYAEMWKSLLEKGHWYGEVWNRRKNGKVYAELLTISAVQNTAGQVQNYVALFTDITAMKEHQSQLEHIAHYDALTNLPNRVLLADRLSQAMVQCQRHQQSLAVAFLDLDGFKEVNDAHGHNVGDELLITLSQRMKEALREDDTLARIGGDEFVAVLPDLAKVEDCQPVLDRLLQVAADPVTVGEIELKVTASIGVAIYPQDHVDADHLLRHADQAMYVAKQAGKNRYHLFDTAQDDAVKIQREKLVDIRSALDRREFVLYYQPKVNMHTGEVIGVEALIRWQHPVRGLVPPLLFLPVIENHAISLDIGEWVIDTALIQISQWQSMGIHLPISVNIAAYQLQQDNFVTRLSDLLAAHPEVAPHHLELEVLETSAISDMSQVSATMNACIDLDVRFALDDFGTGYSSLTYLRRLPAHLIKIDQSFVRDMLIDPEDLAIIEGVVGLAKAFQREVIAEGVETIEHGVALLQLGCDLAQGYGVARPMPAKDIPAWVGGWKPDESWNI